MMRIGPGGTSQRLDPARSTAVKGWVRDELGLDESVTIVVTELTCTEPGCPPRETVIALLAPGSQRKFTLHQPLDELTRDQVVAALVTIDDGHDHR